MKTSTLQRLLAFNSTMITDLHGMIEKSQDEAKYWKAIGEKSFSLAAYKTVDKLRKALQAAVATQIELKEEVHHNTNEERYYSEMRGACKQQ